MDVSRYAAGPEAYDRLSAYQIVQFFNKHELTRAEADHFATKLLGSPVSTTLVQGETSYTVSSDEAAQIVQFRHSQLPMNLIEHASRVYGDFVPECKYRGKFGPVHVYTASLVPGPAFCRIKRQFFSSAHPADKRLKQTVQDFARFFAAGWTRKHARMLEPPPGLLEKYLDILDKVSPGLPHQLQERLEEVRQGLPRLFRLGYPMVLQHDDLLENNIHVDEATGRITGVVDWADAKIAPFGISLAGMEIVLGIQNRTDWHFHPDHQSLRQLFWDSFYTLTGRVSSDDRRSIEIARQFGFFRDHGFEEKEHSIAYLSALCRV